MKFVVFIFIFVNVISSQQILLSELNITNSTNSTPPENKNNIVIKKIFSYYPFIGEILALANIHRIELIINSLFIQKEQDLFKKYITMLDVGNTRLDDTSIVMLNLILTNPFLRQRLMTLVDGLYELEDRNIQILKELVLTVLIDNILNTKFLLYRDIQAKNEIVKVFNKEFKYKSTAKIQFLGKLRIDERTRDEFITLVMKYKDNEDINIALTKSNEITSDAFIGNLPIGGITIMTRVEARELLLNLGRFKQNDNAGLYIPPKYFEFENYDLNKEQQLVLTEVKSIISNDTSMNSYYELGKLEESGSVQIGISGRNIYSKLISHIDSLLRLNCILDNFPIDTPVGSVNVAGNVKALLINPVPSDFRFKANNDTIPSDDFIKQQLLNNPAIARTLKNSTIMFPDHIEQFYDVPKLVNKTIQVTPNSKIFLII
jgi:hypothetical protein